MLKTKLSGLRRDLDKIKAADPRSAACDLWWRAVWNVEVTVEAVEQRLAALGDARTDLMHAAVVVLVKESTRWGITSAPEVVDAMKGLRRALNMRRAAREFGFDSEQWQAVRKIVEDAADKALSVVIDVQAKWPGKMTPAPFPRPTAVVPSWVGTITDAELIGCACPELTDQETSEWLSELPPAADSEEAAQPA
jgi:hypothetical protein